MPCSSGSHSSSGLDLLADSPLSFVDTGGIFNGPKYKQSQSFVFAQ